MRKRIRTRDLVTIVAGLTMLGAVVLLIMYLPWVSQ